MSIKSIVYFTFFILVAQSSFAADPAFEGYYKFILGGQHSGYVVQRFEINDAKKQMTSTYYVFVKTPSGSTTESLVAKSDLSFEPISYQYSALVDGKMKSVDATFKNKKMTAKMTDNGKTQSVILNVPQNGFLSTFLNYVMLKNGLMVGKNYEYYALAEESPACFKGDKNCKATDVGFIKGTAGIKAEQKVGAVDAYKVDFNYKGVSFIGLLSHAGETLGSISPMQEASTELVSSRQAAVGAFPFKEKHIRALFGDIPAGKKNALNITAAAPSMPPPEQAPVPMK
ncbi:MAG: hypothetical protein KDD38_03635, partial [Bdellovibrionales bacterium]|nr:hypothetical protein [Bdellovibrionales bacterium]